MAIPEVVKELLESGVHFGHLSKNWNPKMKKFIFGKKKNIYIIDLEKTAQKLAEAKEFVAKAAGESRKILFVATKRQLRDLIKEAALSCGMFYVVERWIGGLLTNFSTVSRQIKRYVVLLEKRDKGEFEKMPRKEVVRLNREIERMEKNYSGVVSLEELPACLYIVDPKREAAAVREAQRLSLPIVALIDTNADPQVIDYPIPGNDDAIKSVRLITSHIVEAIKEGLKKQEEIIARESKEDNLGQEDSEIAEKAAGEATEGEKKASISKRPRKKKNRT